MARTARRPVGRAVPESPPRTVRRPVGRAVPESPPVPSYGGIDAPAAGGYSKSERYLSISSTVLGGVLPAVYGSRRVVGQTCAVGSTGFSTDPFYVAVALCEGEVGAISGIEINGDGIATISWVDSYESKVGSTSQSVATILSTGLSQTERWPGVAYIAIKGTQQDLFAVPSSMIISAETTGREVVDFRDSSTAVTSNPVLVAYDILTDAEAWAGIATTKIDATSWEDVADWCDDSMGDSSARWMFNGIIYERNPWAAAQAVLDHCFAWMTWHNGKIYMAASQTLTHTGACEIEVDDWITIPSWTVTPLTSRPEIVTLRYTDSSTWYPVTYVSSAASVSSPERQIEVSLHGCTSDSMAARWATQNRLLTSLENVTWRGTCGPVAADLLPGDPVIINTPDGTSDQNCRVLSITDLPNRTYDITVRKYDSSAQSTATS